MLLVSYCYLLVERGDYAIVRNAPFVIQQAHGFRPCRAVAILKKRPEQLCLLCCGKRMENAPQSFRFRVPVRRIAWRSRVNSHFMSDDINEFAIVIGRESCREEVCQNV